jgi:hypothetical protein
MGYALEYHPKGFICDDCLTQEGSIDDAVVVLVSSSAGRRDVLKALKKITREITDDGLYQGVREFYEV